MSIKNKLEKDLLTAMKEKNETRKKALRLALSSIKLGEVETGEKLNDLAVFGILQKEIKIREETIDEARKADRSDMIKPLEDEIEILKEYLPKKHSDDELKAIVAKIISDTGASSMKEMGIVMKAAIQEVQGRAPNDRISKITQELLSTGKS